MNIHTIQLIIIALSITSGIKSMNEEKLSDRFVQAAFDGNIRVLGTMCADNPKFINTYNEVGYTALHAACIAGHEHIVSFLLEQNADTTLPVFDHSIVTSYKNTHFAWALKDCRALHLAAHYSKNEIIKLLIAHKSDHRARNAQGCTPLHACAASGNIAGFLLIVQHDPEALNVKDKEGDDPFIMAIRCGASELIKTLLKSNLIDRHTLAWHYDKNGLTSLHIACKHNQIDLIEPLFYAMDVSPDFIPSGADPDCPTLLTLGVKAGSTPVIQKLISLGADPRLKDGHGKTPLAWAIEGNQSEIVDYLLELDAHIGTKELLEKSLTQDPRIFEALCMHMAPYELFYEFQGNSFFHIAILQSDFNFIQKLLKRSMQYSNDPTIPAYLRLALHPSIILSLQNKHGNTLLHLKALDSIDSDEMLELLNYKPQLDRANHRGLTPLCVALFSCNFKMAQILYEHGADFRLTIPLIHCRFTLSNAHPFKNHPGSCAACGKQINEGFVIDLRSVEQNMGGIRIKVCSTLCKNHLKNTIT